MNTNFNKLTKNQLIEVISKLNKSQLINLLQLLYPSNTNSNQYSLNQVPSNNVMSNSVSTQASNQLNPVSNQYQQQNPVSNQYLQQNLVSNQYPQQNPVSNQYPQPNPVQNQQQNSGATYPAFNQYQPSASNLNNPSPVQNQQNPSNLKAASGIYSVKPKIGQTMMYINSNGNPKSGLIEGKTSKGFKVKQGNQIITVPADKRIYKHKNVNKILYKPPII